MKEESPINDLAAIVVEAKKGRGRPKKDANVQHSLPR